MGPVALTAALVAAVVVVAILLVATVALLRSARAQRERLDRELLASRAEVGRLSQAVAALSDEVTDTRRAAEVERDYVITSLSGDGADHTRLAPYGGERDRAAVGRVVEDQLVGVLARNRDATRLRARAVDLVVHTVALGHGVRRALSPDVLDRAAAEAHVARRRSRRERRRELREARRLVRGTRVAGDPEHGRTPGRGREDAA